MKIKININKTIEQNAALYYEKAKKLKKKLEGAKKALERSKLKLEKLKKREIEIKKREKTTKKTIVKREWYEKFHWFISSTEFLVIGGKDATSNEIVIKKHTDKDDLVFHTEITGSPFVVIKSEGKKVDDNTMKEAAQLCASYSRAWRLGIGRTEVYKIKPDQVKKEFGLPKGSFMIHGKREYFSPKLEIAVGVDKDNKVIGGPVSAVKKHSTKYVIVVPGKHKKTDIAKKIKKKLGDVEIDDIIRFLPAGGCEILWFIERFIHYYNLYYNYTTYVKL